MLHATCCMPPACFEAANLIPIYIVVADLDTRYYVLDSSVSILDSGALLLIFKLKIIILRTQFSAICQNIVYCSTPEPASRQLPSLPQVCSLQSAVSGLQCSVLAVFSLRPATHKGPSSGSAAVHFKLIEIFQRFSPLPMLPVVSSACSSVAM